MSLKHNLPRDWETLFLSTIPLGLLLIMTALGLPETGEIDTSLNIISGTNS